LLLAMAMAMMAMAALPQRDAPRISLSVGSYEHCRKKAEENIGYFVVSSLMLIKANRP
jgi:hypothetical protein